MPGAWRPLRPAPSPASRAFGSRPSGFGCSGPLLARGRASALAAAPGPAAGALSPPLSPPCGASPVAALRPASARFRARAGRLARSGRLPPLPVRPPFLRPARSASAGRLSLAAGAGPPFGRPFGPGVVPPLRPASSLAGALKRGPLRGRAFFAPCAPARGGFRAPGVVPDKPFLRGDGHYIRRPCRRQRLCKPPYRRPLTPAAGRICGRQAAQKKKLLTRGVRRDILKAWTRPIHNRIGATPRADHASNTWPTAGDRLLDGSRPLRSLFAPRRPKACRGPVEISTLLLLTGRGRLSAPARYVEVWRRPCREGARALCAFVKG